jgi:hypothetical protein
MKTLRRLFTSSPSLRPGSFLRHLAGKEFQDLQGCLLLKQPPELFLERLRHELTRKHIRYDVSVDDQNTLLLFNDRADGLGMLRFGSARLQLLTGEGHLEIHPDTDTDGARLLYCFSLYPLRRFVLCGSAMILVFTLFSLLMVGDWVTMLFQALPAWLLVCWGWLYGMNCYILEQEMRQLFKRADKSRN